MEKPFKIILYVIVAILFINLLFSLFGNSNIKSIRQDLEKARRTSDSALNELRFSRARLDSIKADMAIFGAYLDRVNKTVALNDAEKRVKEKIDQETKREIEEKIKTLKEALANDTLPIIQDKR